MPVAAYHIILANYGFWLPNDPRGFARGNCTWPADQQRKLPHAAQSPPSRMTGNAAAPPRTLSRDAPSSSRANKRKPSDSASPSSSRSGVRILACAIMPRHTHLVIDRPPYPAEQAANLLKGAATAELTRRGLHPFADAPYKDGRVPTPWRESSGFAT